MKPSDTAGLCGLNQSLCENNVDISPLMEMICTLQYPSHFLPVLHTLFGAMPVYVKQCAFAMFKKNYGKIMREKPRLRDPNGFIVCC